MSARISRTLNIGKGTKKARDNREQVQSPKRKRYGHNQLALGGRIFAGCPALGLVHVFQNAIARLQIDLPGFCKDNFPCRAIEEPRFEMCFQFGYPPADSGQRDAKLAARG